MDKREFCGSFSVKIDTQRVAFELSPGTLYGGPDGFYRVRINRRWADTTDGKPRFFDRAALALLVVDAALGSLPKLNPAPDVPYPARVSVRRVRNDEMYYVGAWTTSPPILDHAGRWVVNVSIDGTREFVPVNELILHKGVSRG